MIELACVIANGLNHVDVTTVQTESFASDWQRAQDWGWLPADLEPFYGRNRYDRSDSLIRTTSVDMAILQFQQV